MTVLVDTNVLLRIVQTTHPHFHAASRSVSSLLGRGETVYFCPQNVSEFWCVATRPVERNGLGLSISDVVRELGAIERLLTFLPDSAAVHSEWRRLVEDHQVCGVQVYDARPAARAPKDFMKARER